MKTFERIFLYTVLTILVFYVFLVDGNVESQAVIQEEIRARSIVIVNDAGQEVVELFATDDGGGMIGINNKTGNRVVGIADFEDSGMIGIYNKTGTPVVFMNTLESGGGMIGIGNKTGTPFACMGSNDASGAITIFNSAGNLGVILETMRDFGRISIFNKTGTQVVNMNATTDGKGAIGIIKGGMISVGNEAGNMVACMADLKDDGILVIQNKDGKVTSKLP